MAVEPIKVDPYLVPTKVGQYTIWFRELTLGEMESVAKHDGKLNFPALFVRATVEKIEGGKIEDLKLSEMRECLKIYTRDFL